MFAGSTRRSPVRVVDDGGAVATEGNGRIKSVKLIATAATHAIQIGPATGGWGNVRFTRREKARQRFRCMGLPSALVRLRASREAVADWMETNQLGRRNLSPDQRSLLRGRIYNRTKRHAEDNLKRGDASPKYQSDTSGDTAATLASKHGVGRMTIIRDGKRAELFDELEKIAPEEADAVRRGIPLPLAIKRHPAALRAALGASRTCSRRKPPASHGRRTQAITRPPASARSGRGRDR